jgi:PDZ domain
MYCRTTCLFLSLAVAMLVIPGTAVADPPAKDAPAEENIAYWVEQLGHDQFLRRELATQKLVEAGPQAIPQLIEQIRSGNLEVVERATGAIAEIALARPPIGDGGAWDFLNGLATTGTGRASSCAAAAVEDIRNQRAREAREALAMAGIFVGMDDFAIRAISQPREIIQIDEKWRGDKESLQWLRWLDGIENARIKGPAVTREVLDHVTEIPGIKSVAIVDGNVSGDTLEPLKKIKRIGALEFRYVVLTDEQGDMIAQMPIRGSLTLMGTGISAQKVESMRSALPGLQIDHRQGGFLGVTCIDGFDDCKINGVVAGSAAEIAGLIEGDVIVQVQDAPVHRFKDLQSAINQFVPGDEVSVTFRRGEKIETVKLKLQRFDES